MIAPLRPTSLRCDYRQNPLGVDVRQPGLSWTLECDDPAAKNIRQRAYQIVAASSAELLKKNPGDLWDSRRTESSRTLHIPYAGSPLLSCQQVFWKVRSWSDGEASDWSAPATFTMGLVEKSDWTAHWISGPTTGALPIFRRRLKIEKPLRRAIVFICGLGHFELSVNGNAVGANLLDPPWTNYAKRCLYTTHDLTPILQTGENTLGVMLGNGMYNVVGGRYRKFKGSFGPPKLICQLHLYFSDRSAAIVGSDENWEFAPGPITFSCIYGGEDYDANRRTPAEADWKPAAICESPGGELRAAATPPIAAIETIQPASVIPLDAKTTIYDFGRNFSGRAVVKLRGGSTIKLLPAELLDATGRITQKNTGGPISFAFTSDSKEEIWHPRFSYSGFRYLQAEGDTQAVTEMSAGFIHSSAAVVGEFECSDPLLNRIHDLILAAIRSNLQSVLTDCPHREKLGWLEQAYLMGPAICCNFDMSQLYRKICADMRDAQHENGCVPTFAPQYTSFKEPWQIFNDSPEWGSAAVMCPWIHFQRYGDIDILRENYPMMRRYVAYLQSKETDGIIDFGLGDWYDIGPGDPGFSKLTSKGLTGTAIYFADLNAMSCAARLLGHDADAAADSSAIKRIAAAFNKTFFDSRLRRYDRGSQCAQAMPLALNLLALLDRSAVLQHLVDDIRAHDNHITAGDIGFRFVIDALAEAGRSDVIYDLLQRTDPPSYGSQLERGATALTEAWDANPKNSQNHLMLGHAEFWFYRDLAGIHFDLSRNDPHKIRIAPQIVAGIDWARASYRSVLGDIESNWKRSEGKIELSVRIPPNALATVSLPGMPATQIGSGSYRFEIADPAAC